jgi:hypothetical protein
VQPSHPHKSVERWSMDEHRIGLKPILRRVWAPKGATVVAPVAPRYQWMDVSAFVYPESGRSRWFLLPGVHAEVCSQVLEVLAQEVEAGAGKEILLMLDGAGWHTSASLSLPQGIQLLFLPPYSPEIQRLSGFGSCLKSHWPTGSSPL